MKNCSVSKMENNIIWVESGELLSMGKSKMYSIDTLLDIGCGIVPQEFVHASVHVCCEPYQEYVHHLQNKIKSKNGQEKSWIVLNMGWSDVVNYFPENSVDSAILVDVIEHLDKEAALSLLAKTQKIVRNQLIIFTPWGFMPQHHEDGKDGWGLSGGAWQEHKSGWLPEDFIEGGWTFVACKDFHKIDSSGQKLDEPFGAFWAIYSKQIPQKPNGNTRGASEGIFHKLARVLRGR